MADNWTDWYSGAMAPPLKTPGGYAPAPSMQPQMSPEEVYAGIYGEPLAGPTTRSVKSVPIDPATRMPAKTPLPNQPAGSIVAAKDESRLPANAFGYGTNGVSGNSAVAAIENAASRRPLPSFTGSDPFSAYVQAGDYAAKPRFGSGAPADDGIIDLNLTDLSDRGAQAMADSQGQPLRNKGKTYYPGGKAPAGTPVSGRLGAADDRGPLSKLLGLKERPSLGGLLSGMFMGGNRTAAPSAGLGGGLGALLGGGPSSIGTSPSQGQAMVVLPGTSTGQTLSSMGFSDGGLVPAATVRNLSARGYI